MDLSHIGTFHKQPGALKMAASACPRLESVPESQNPVWSVVVPMRDEAGNAGPLLDEIAAAMARIGPFEIVVIDDGSRDATATELAAARARHPMATVLTCAVSCGQSQALIAGAVAARGRWLIAIDGDGQNDPADIAKLVEAHGRLGDDAGRGLVIGHRRVRADGAVKRIASHIAAAARRLLLADTTPDTGCGLKILARETFLTLPRFDALHRFVPVLVARDGGRVVSVAVSHRPRRHGVSKYGVLRRGVVGIVDLVGVAWLIWRNTRPRISR